MWWAVFIEIPNWLMQFTNYEQIKWIWNKIDVHNVVMNVQWLQKNLSCEWCFSWLSIVILCEVLTTHSSWKCSINKFSPGHEATWNWFAMIWQYVTHITTRVVTQPIKLNCGASCCFSLICFHVFQAYAMFQISRKCQRDKVFFCECKMGLCLAETLSD